MDSQLIPFRWRVYFADGTTVDDTTHAPWDVPRYPRVVAIAQPCADGNFESIIVNGTYYLWRNDLGCWFRHETAFDVVLELQDHPLDIRACLIGKYISKPQFTAIWKRAREDMGLHV